MMDDGIREKAKELGRLLGQTDEYQALQRARQRVNEERELVTLLNRMAELEESVAGALERGETPAEAAARDYEATFSELQANPAYQGLVAAQANFEKIMARVHEEMGVGIAAGAQSRIILPS